MHFEIAESPAQSNVQSAPGNPAGARVESEFELVNQASAGREDAFAELISGCVAKTYHLAFRMIRHREDAEDAHQETLLKAYLHLGRFEGRSRFSTWLSRIAINEALMKVRARRCRPQLSLEEALETGDARILGAGIGQHPEKTYAQRELLGKIVRVIQGLQPHLRRVFLMRAVEQRSTSETAKALRMSVSAVKTLLRRSRIELKRRLVPILQSAQPD